MHNLGQFLKYRKKHTFWKKLQTLSEFKHLITTESYRGFNFVIREYDHLVQSLKLLYDKFLRSRNASLKLYNFIINAYYLIKVFLFKNLKANTVQQTC